jgi:acyl-CoA reductase-like NAD-dependent aldehyde dehydrogenase
VPEALGEIDRSIAALRYFATFDLTREVHREDATQKVVRQQRPLGAVAGITPWNVPVILLLVKVAPALLAGNTVVAKPAPTAPLTTLRFGEFCARILPPGVVNVIVDPNDLGTTLSHHPNMARVAFIGNHGVSLSFYFADPEGHLVEVYRPAGGVCRPLHAHSIDLTRSEEALRQGVAELAVQAGAEG